MTDQTKEHHDLAPTTATTLDPVAALNGLLSDVGLSTGDAGGKVTFAGSDPILPARHRMGACIGIPIMGNAVAAAALLRHRGGPAKTFTSTCVKRCTTSIHTPTGIPTWPVTCPRSCCPTTPSWGTLRNPRRAVRHRHGRVSASGRQVVPIPRCTTGFRQSDRSNRSPRRLEFEDEANDAGLPTCVAAPRRMAEPSAR